MDDTKYNALVCFDGMWTQYASDSMNLRTVTRQPSEVRIVHVVQAKASR